MKEKRHKIRIQDIISFEGNSNYTIIFYNDGTQYLSGYTLGFFEKKYAFSPDFLRIHKSTIINKKYLQFIENKNGFVQLTNGKRFEVSRRRVQILNDINE
jgi:DNA-binding LytR/AlgR family response regulator